MKQGIPAVGVLVFAIPLILYLKVMNVGFLSDDYGFVSFYQITWHNLVRCIGQIHSGNLAINPFRPAAFVSLCLDYHIYGWNPVGFHLTNILLHSLNTLLLWLLVRAFKMPDWSAFVTAVFYGLYPGHPEAVTWISGRFDVLSHAFILGSLLLWIKGRSRENNSILALSAFLYLLSLLSKETAAAGILLYPLADWLIMPEIFNPKNRHRIKFIITWLIVQSSVLLLFILMRIWLFGNLAGDAGWTRLNPFPDLTLTCCLNTFGIDLWMLLIPVNRLIFMDWVTVIIGALNIALIAGGVVSAIVFLIKKDIVPFRLVIFGIFYTIIFLLPTIPIGPVSENLNCSRYLYMPAGGIAIIAGAGFYYFARIPKFTRFALVVIFVMWIFASAYILWQHNNVWIETGRIGRQIDRTICENTCDIPDGTRILVVNLPWLWKGAHVAPNGFDSYLEFVHGKRGLSLDYAVKEPSRIDPWLECLKHSSNHYVCFLWDESREILIPLE